MATTYEPIATTTISGATSVTFNSIPATYTDLRLIINAYVSSGSGSLSLTFNNNSSALYSQTTLYGSGSSAGSQRNTGTNNINVSFAGLSTQPHLYTMDIFSYAGSTNKSCLQSGGEDDNGSGYIHRESSLYRSTSAISRIDLSNQSGGSPKAFYGTATIYGILRA